MITVYYALFELFLRYSITFWGSAGDCVLTNCSLFYAKIRDIRDTLIIEKENP